MYKRQLFTTWITIPSAKRKELIKAIVAAGERLIAADPTDWKARVMATVIDLNDRYPGDIGVLGALLLNHIELAPGEAVYLDAGQLHAYVSGLGVEIMANSDNVLRGGLTPKFVDVPELVKVLTYAAATEPRVQQKDKQYQDNVHGAEAWSYPVPIDEFLLDRAELGPDSSVDLDYDGPTIALCTAGSLNLRNAAGEELILSPGQAAWLPASEGVVTAHAHTVNEANPEGPTAQLFVARV